MTVIVPEIPRAQDVHDRTGVNIRDQRVVPGDPPTTMCPIGTCMAMVPIACFVSHLDGHADRGERA